MKSDSARTECSTTKEISKEENSTSSMMAACDTMSSSIIEEEFTIKFDSAGKPTEFHATKQEWKKISKSEKAPLRSNRLKPICYLAIAIISLPTSYNRNTTR